MPIYEYHCLACGEAFERLVTGQSSVTCPACGSAEVTKRFSLFGVKTGSRAVGSGGGCGCGAGGCGCR